MAAILPGVGAGPSVDDSVIFPSQVTGIYDSLKNRIDAWKDSELSELLDKLEVNIQREISELRVVLDGADKTRLWLKNGHPGEFGVNVKNRGLNIENLEVLEFLVRLEVQRRINLGGVGASQ